VFYLASAAALAAAAIAALPAPRTAPPRPLHEPLSRL
jgi:hypothetical protein